MRSRAEAFCGNGKKGGKKNELAVGALEKKKRFVAKKAQVVVDEAEAGWWKRKWMDGIGWDWVMTGWKLLLLLLLRKGNKARRRKLTLPAGGGAAAAGLKLSLRSGGPTARLSSLGNRV
ncbi:hypothetical protein PG995_002981 [Apiospora arundinis]